MRYTLLLVGIATALFTPASAQQTATVGVGTAPAGRIRTTNTPTVISYDGQWVMDGFLLTDKNGESKLHWDSLRQVAHNGMAVFWSPDSQRVVMVDHSGRGVLFFCAELQNGQWYDVPVSRPYHAPEGQDTDDPKQPANDRVDKVELGKWISPTELHIMKRVLADNSRSNPQWFDYTLVLRFENGKAVEYAAN